MLTRAILKQSTSWSAIACCAIMVFGFMLGVDQEGVAGKTVYRDVFSFWNTSYWFGHAFNVSYIVRLHFMNVKRIHQSWGIL